MQGTREAFELYQLRQIYFFNVYLPDYNGNNYIPNMFDKSQVYEELIENILYVNLKIIENN
jgi:hypothetical protein